MNDDRRVLRHAFLREMKGYTKRELQEIFSCDEITLTKILRILRYKKYLKIHKRDDGILDMSHVADELVDVSDAMADVSGFSYVFDFVGIIVVGGFVIKCYPKYILHNNQPVSEFKQVLKVLERYNGNQYIVNMYSEHSDDKNFNLLELILFLLHDYYEYGIYRHNKTIVEKNGTGEILWNRTVDSSFAIIDDDVPYYVELRTRKKVSEENNYFKRLHECIITECSKIIHQAGLFEYFDELVPVDLTDLNLSDFGSDDYILYKLERELGQQYNTHKRLVLQILHSYVAKESSLNEMESISVFGTNSFNLVWESVCATVLDNKLNVKLKNLTPIIGELKNEFANMGDCSLIEIIKKPKWTNFSNTGAIGKTQESDTLIPDIISLFSIASETCMSILDAKYYVVQFEPRLKGQPGLGDITKQYLYNLAYKKFISSHGIKSSNITNCFLMPSEEQFLCKRGFANMDILADLDFVDVKNIDVILLPASNMYEMYLNRSSFGEELFKLLTLGDREHYGDIFAM